MPPEKFEESPIIFGDFINVTAADSDRMYEDLRDMKKLFAVLSEVVVHLDVCCSVVLNSHYCSISMTST